jgi:hypothetical protein
MLTDAEIRIIGMAVQNRIRGMTRRKRQVNIAPVAVLREVVEGMAAAATVMAGDGANRADTADDAGAAAVDIAKALLARRCHWSRRRGWEGSEQEGLGCMVWHLCRVLNRERSREKVRVCICMCVPATMVERAKSTK